MVKISYTRIKKFLERARERIIYLLFTPISLPYNIHIKQNVLHNFGGRVITLNTTDFIAYLNRAVFFSICLTGCFYNDNEQAAL